MPNDSDQLLERLAALEHDQWREWSMKLAADERISEERLARWQTLWVDYQGLLEEDKEDDRVYARKVLDLLPAGMNLYHIKTGDVVEVTWLDAGMFDRLTPEDLEEDCPHLVTRSYGIVRQLTDRYLALLQNESSRTDSHCADDGNSVFAIPLGTIERVQIIRPYLQASMLVSQNGGRKP